MGRARTLSGWLLAVTLVGVTAGCGLPDPRPLLPPPRDPFASDTADTFSFSQPTGAGSDRVPGLATFGYEVYYRFSGTEEAADPLLRRLQDLDQLRDNGFVGLRKADDLHPLAAAGRPLIAVPSAARAEHRVTLSFAALEAGADPHATLSSGGRISLRRGVETFGQYDRFACEEFGADDRDVAAYPELIQDCAAGERVQLQLYAVAYGRDAARAEQFSEPLYLGSIDVTFGN